jgi:hypothetical protein
VGGRELVHAFPGGDGGVFQLNPFGAKNAERKIGGDPDVFQEHARDGRLGQTPDQAGAAAGWGLMKLIELRPPRAVLTTVAPSATNWAKPRPDPALSVTVESPTRTILTGAALRRR